MTIDAVATKAAITGQLAALEDRARAEGVAIGIATGSPETISALAAWSRSLQERGITLVPATAGVAAGPIGR